MIESIPIGPKGFIDSHGESIYFESYGAGETILLGHGRGGNHAIWYQQVPILAQQYQVVIWDQRGFGRSSNRLAQASPAAAAQDIVALLDHLQVEQAHLVGQSMGGWAVLGAALQWPERVQSLILADTIAGIYTPEIEAVYDRYIALRAVQPPLVELANDGHLPAETEVTEAHLIQIFLYDQIGSLATPPRAKLSNLTRQTAYDLDQVRALSLPTLFIVGQYDPIFPPAIIRQAATFVPHAQVVEIPGAAHSPYFETPQLWNEAVLGFVKAQSNYAKANPSAV